LTADAQPHAVLSARTPIVSQPWTFNEYFAGGAFARLGLGPAWRCLFANDFDRRKAASYRANFPDAASVLRVADVAALTINDLPSRPVDLLTMGPPCVGHSEAGDRQGFDDEESKAFWPAWALTEALIAAGRAPRTLLFENVAGIRPENLAAVQAAFTRAGYRCARRVVDARHFTPQSRERWFIVGSHESLGVDPEPLFERAMRALPKRSIELVDVIDFDAVPDRWEFPPGKVERCLAMMSAGQRAQFDKARATGRPFAGPFSKRMRDVPGSGKRVQRVEVRFDGLASALRVPGGRVQGKSKGGGSSKQFVITVNGGKIRMRAIQPREAARLMGLPDSYVLPANPIEALSLVGDGVVVPVVRHLAEHILEPLLEFVHPSRLARTDRLAAE
jgi:DNA (cytosine-5)-methyltransferase 1